MARPAGYSFWIDAGTLRLILTLSTSERRALDRIFQFLAGHPHFTGDYQERDNDGRMNEVFLQGRFIVTFWTDHAVREVSIVRVEKA